MGNLPPRSCSISTPEGLSMTSNALAASPPLCPPELCANLCAKPTSRIRDCRSAAVLGCEFLHRLGAGPFESASEPWGRDAAKTRRRGRLRYKLPTNPRS